MDQNLFHNYDPTKCNQYSLIPAQRRPLTPHPRYSRAFLKSITHRPQARRSRAPPRDRRRRTQHRAQTTPTPLIIHLRRHRLTPMQLKHHTPPINLWRGCCPSFGLDSIQSRKVISFSILRRRHLIDFSMSSKFAVRLLFAIYPARGIELFVRWVQRVGIIGQGFSFDIIVVFVEVREADVFGGSNGGWSVTTTSL
jgi:hypothetical protein